MYLRPQITHVAFFKWICYSWICKRVKRIPPRSIIRHRETDHSWPTHNGQLDYNVVCWLLFFCFLFRCGFLFFIYLFFFAFFFTTMIALSLSNHPHLGMLCGMFHNINFSENVDTIAMKHELRWMRVCMCNREYNCTKYAVDWLRARVRATVHWII